MGKTTLSITGMSCKHCVSHVENTLKSVPKTAKVKVSLKDNSAIITHDNSVTAQMLIDAVTEAGYTAICE